MNTLKRTLALVATLAMASTAFASCGKDDSSSSSEATTAADAATEAPTDDNGSESSAFSADLGEVKLKTGGDQFTVVAWNDQDVPKLLENWGKFGGDTSKNNFISFGVGGGDASEKYDALFQSGDDLDVYFCEADWALKYINDDTKTAALEDLGFSEANFADVYDYTNEIGRATEGANAGKIVGASWQAAPGGFAYRADLAKEYLGVNSPEEMQAKIEGWDNFVAAATTVAEATDGKVALADSLGGMWQVFAANRTQPWLSNGRLTFDSSCEDFAKIAKTLWDNGGVTKNGQWTDSWIPAGQDGTCMGYFVSTWGFGETAFFGQASSKSHGQWALCEGPAPYFWGGTWIVVNPNTDNADLAQSFIFNSTVDKEAMKEYAVTKPDYVNNKVVMQELVDAKTDPDSYVTENLGGQNYFAVLHENAKAINLKGLITPYDALVKGKFLDQVTKVYCEGGSYEDTISAAMDDVLTVNPDLG